MPQTEMRCECCLGFSGRCPTCRVCWTCCNCGWLPTGKTLAGQDAEEDYPLADAVGQILAKALPRHATKR
jgi:hypothetical protein